MPTRISPLSTYSLSANLLKSQKQDGINNAGGNLSEPCLRDGLRGLYQKGSASGSLQKVELGTRRAAKARLTISTDTIASQTMLGMNQCTDATHCRSACQLVLHLSIMTALPDRVRILERRGGQQRNIWRGSEQGMHAGSFTSNPLL